MATELEVLQAGDAAVRKLHSEGRYADNRTLWQRALIVASRQYNGLYRGLICIHCCQPFPCATVRALDTLKR
jgi:hypothetical protein